MARGQSPALAALSPRLAASGASGQRRGGIQQQSLHMMNGGRHWLSRTQQSVDPPCMQVGIPGTRR